MSILDTELVWRYPEDHELGGRMTASPIVSGVKNNIWPDVLQDERVSGSTAYRKVFIHAANIDDLTLVNARVFVETYTPGDDSITIFPGTQTDTSAGITGSEQQYGSGYLQSAVSSGASTIIVETEGVALDYFTDTMLIRISDKATVSSPGNAEYRTITGEPTYSVNAATITLDAPLSNGYASGTTRVASVIPVGDIIGSATAIVSTGGGSYDDVTYPIAVNSIAGIEQNWTLNFTDNNIFDVVGDTVGTVATGITTDSNVQPSNPDYVKPYFVMDKLGFSGTYVSGDTITFSTSPASTAIWYKRVIPPGASSLTGDKVIVAIDGESE